MDQHPIPQDVTGFQFKLIGTMTVKQFGFVASGVVMAVVLYYMPLNTPFSFLIKLLLIPLLGAGGVVIAFVPIDGRPIDVMATNFVKALFSPNQYVYHRQGRKLSFSTVNVVKAPVVQKNAAKAAETGTPQPTIPKPSTANKEEQLRALLMSSRGTVKNDLDKKEVAFLKNFAPVTAPAAPAAATAPAMPKPAAPAPTPAPVKAVPAPAPLPIAQPAAPKPANPVMQPATPLPAAPTPAPIATHAPAAASTPAPAPQKETSESLTTKENELEKELAQAKQEETTSPTPAVAHQKVTDLEKQIQDIHAQKVQLEQELTKLKTQLSEQKNPVPAVPTPSAAPAAPAPIAATPAAPQPAGIVQDPAHVRTISLDVSKKIGLPKVSDTPNVVIGIVKDPRGNVLSNILVEVKDKDGNPVRAFKTNPLGQFASATPLSPGTYTMELEDPKKQQRFDVIQIVANNQIMPPIEVISHDAREELRQQLFAN